MAFSSSSASTPAQERDAQLLSFGQQCSDPTCMMVDFLPFKCQHCEQSFCQEHFKVDAHKCPKYDETKHNRVAPNCPLCNTPVAVRQGQDPNVRMDFHLEKECFVVTGKVKAKTTPVCARPTCKKVLFSPIRCDKCRQQFCPAHRFPGDHSCSPQAAPAPPTYGSNLLSKFENLGSKAAAAASKPSVKQPITTTGAPAPKPAPAPRPLAAASSSSSSSHPSTSTTTSKPKPKPLPFSKMDRRARAERESKLKAMRTRSQKGLLTGDEKAVLAAEEEAAAEKKDCVVM